MSHAATMAGASPRIQVWRVSTANPSRRPPSTALRRVPRRAATIAPHAGRSASCEKLAAWPATGFGARSRRRGATPRPTTLLVCHAIRRASAARISAAAPSSSATQQVQRLEVAGAGDDKRERVEQRRQRGLAIDRVAVEDPAMGDDVADGGDRGLVGVEELTVEPGQMGNDRRAEHDRTEEHRSAQTTGRFERNSRSGLVQRDGGRPERRGRHDRRVT